MGTNLHQLLRSLCFNTDWNYAIFWKLQHRARMILTWEDTCYDIPGEKSLEQIGGAQFSHDALGLAVAKMSYHVYSLGEGVVGQVAVTGKHRWICADKQVTGSGSCFEFADGWQSQFSAGIRTIVFVAVVPLGVVQLGSINKVIEDMEVVTHIRNLFLSSKDCSIDHIPSQIQSSLNNSSDTMPEETKKIETLDVLMPLQYYGKNYVPHSAYEKMADILAKHEGPEVNSDESSILLQPISNMMNIDHQECEEMRPFIRRKCDGGSSDCKDVRLESETNVSSFLHNSISNNDSLYDIICPSEKVSVDSACFPSVCESGKLHNEKLMSQTEPCCNNTSYFQSDPCDMDSFYTLNFPAGCELHEALGPAFLKTSKCSDWEVQAIQDTKTMDLRDEVSSSQVTSSESHLLEAMLANICRSNTNNDVNGELSFCTSMQSAMASGRNHGVAIHNVRTTNNSEGGSIDQSSLVRENKKHCLSSSSGICGVTVMSPKDFSSACHSSYNEQKKSSEPAKNSNKKRTRPGESCRPRPRDRQLIQDRIKELRELVPNGAKCSIDSLLERAIKHMLFLRSITKHFADTKSKLHHMETDAPGSSSYEQGSSWAMEVGGHLKVHSLLVKNLSKNGQMLIEMLCEECSHFLEIAESIRSLGLTILKGATKAQSDKIWICFVVEDQNNRNVHRLDILWPLVQILQSKTAMSSQ